jgi:hypothetical protein
MTYTVQVRRGTLINDDPQRRCYDGCYFKSHMEWEEWKDWTEVPTLEDAERQVRIFQRGDQQLRFFEKVIA